VAIRGYHAHLYFDPHEVDHSRAVAAAAHALLGCPVGHFHTAPVGPHPRGSVQLSLRPEQFAHFAAWASEGREGLTVFAHGLSGDDLADHTRYVIWFGTSEPLDLSIFG
jgi:aromatic ring-cleaving dioxygenase